LHFLTAMSSCHLEDLGGFGVGIEVRLRKDREIRFLVEREGWMDGLQRERVEEFKGEHEWPENRVEFMGEFISTLLEERECFTCSTSLH